ncbi:MAG: hypothetical protein ACRD9L_18570 [Bryobacteraceae bacterium]
MWFLMAPVLAAAPAGAARVTFSRDIAPIVYRHCASCHRAGEVAPFPLTTYQDVEKRAKLIAAVTARRFMPPWKPVHGYGNFAGERRLTDAQIALIQKWAAEGAPEGDPEKLPPAPNFPAGWQLGKPDLVLTMARPFRVPADGDDLYQCFAIPTGLTRDRYVRAMEFQPSNRRVVHHSLLFTDTTGTARRKDSATPEQGYPCFGTIGFFATSALGGFVPGTGPIVEPSGVAAVLHRGADLVAQIHFHPTGKPEEEQSSFGFYFTDKPPEKGLIDIPLTSRSIDIPSGDSHYVVTDHFTLPVDVDAVGIIPHAHYLCREMRGTAILPDGTKKWLIRINDWDFNWQEQYHYAAPVRLPADTEVKMEFIYDNSTANPRNPNSPPKRVRWGPGSTDEMAGLHIEVIPVRMADMHELGMALWGKVMRQVGGEFYRLPTAPAHPSSGGNPVR